MVDSLLVSSKRLGVAAKVLKQTVLKSWDCLFIVTVL
jgi:hypothetical protein